MFVTIFEVSTFNSSWSIVKVRKQATCSKHLPCFEVLRVRTRNTSIIALEYIFIFVSNFMVLLRLEKKIRLHLVTTVGELSEKQIQMVVWYNNMCFCCFRQDEVMLFVRLVALIVMYRSESEADSSIFVSLCSQKTAPEKTAKIRLFFRFSTSYTLIFIVQNFINTTTITGTKPRWAI